ncbi:MAG TPA: response regulator [bacterium]|nr:response regulator [bacterium]
MEIQQKKILIIEDEHDVFMSLSLILKSHGYIVSGAPDGEEGLKKFKKEKPDLVILDVSMPGMDGWQVLEKIKAGFISRRVPVIMLTGKSGEEDKIKGYSYGADYYVTKPYNIDKLLPVIKNMVCR